MSIRSLQLYQRENRSNNAQKEPLSAHTFRVLRVSLLSFYHINHGLEPRASSHGDEHGGSTHGWYRTDGWCTRGGIPGHIPGGVPPYIPTRVHIQVSLTYPRVYNRVSLTYPRVYNRRYIPTIGCTIGNLVTYPGVLWATLSHTRVYKGCSLPYPRGVQGVYPPLPTGCT